MATITGGGAEVGYHGRDGRAERSALPRNWGALGVSYHRMRRHRDEMCVWLHSVSWS